MEKRYPHQESGAAYTHTHAGVSTGGQLTHGTGTTDPVAAHGHLVAIKAADETVNNSTVLQDDNELTLAVEANTIYKCLVYLRFTSSAVADFKRAFTVPAGATLSLTQLVNAAGADPTAVEIDGTGTAAYSGFGAPIMVWPVVGFLSVAGTAGSLTLQWAQNTAEATDTKVLAGSYVELQKA